MLAVQRALMLRVLVMFRRFNLPINLMADLLLPRRRCFFLRIVYYGIVSSFK